MGIFIRLTNTCIQPKPWCGVGGGGKGEGKSEKMLKQYETLCGSFCFGKTPTR